MRKVLFIVAIAALSLFGGCKSSPETMAWKERLDEAVKQAAAENKTVLVNFTGSDWCIWCKRLNDEVFSKPEFSAYAADKLILVKIDFPRNTELPAEQQTYNRQLAQQFGVEGFPTIVLVSADGKTLGVTGYQPGGAANYVQHLKSIIGG